MLRYERDGYSVEAAIRKGRDLPPWYLDEPPIHPSQDFYLQAFSDLSTTRQIGMGPGPIPWDKILLYAHWMELERDVTRAFVQIIQLMDSAYMDWVDKNKANNNPGPTKGFKVVERK